MLPDGTTKSDAPSLIPFGGVLIGELLLLLAILQRGPAEPLRIAGLAATAIGAVGLGALVGFGLGVPLGLGFAIGMPLAYGVERWYAQRDEHRSSWTALRGVVLVGVAVVVAVIATLAGLGVAAWFLAVTIVALVAFGTERRNAPHGGDVQPGSVRRPA